MSEQDQDQVETPPIESQYVEPSAPSRWPKVFGTVSMIYALGGLLCAGAVAFSPWLTEFGTKLGGMSLEFPEVIKIIAAITGALTFGLGVILFFGAINLLRRRKSGVTIMKFWSVARIVLIIIGIVATFLTSPIQVEFAREVMEMQNKMLRDAGRPDRVRELTDEQLWGQILRNSAIFSVVLMIYPLTVGFYFSRQTITEEMESWGEEYEV